MQHLRTTGAQRRSLLVETGPVTSAAGRATTRNASERDSRPVACKTGGTVVASRLSYESGAQSSTVELKALELTEYAE
jgi:hypothetical protein